MALKSTDRTLQRKFKKDWSWKTGDRSAVGYHAEARVWLGEEPIPKAFPLLDKNRIELSFDNTFELFKVLHKCTSVENGRYALASIQFEFHGDIDNRVVGARITATDGRVLVSVAQGTLSGNVVCSLHTPAAITTTILQAFARHRVKSKLTHESRVAVAYTRGTEGDEALLVQSPRGALARIVRGPGTFPDWRSVVPDLKHEAVLPDGFPEAVDVVGRLNAPGAQFVKLGLSADPDETKDGGTACIWRTTAAHPCGATAQHTARGEWGYKTAAASLAFDPVYFGLVVAATKATQGEKARLRLAYTDNDCGMRLLATGRGDDVCLFMPVDAL